MLPVSAGVANSSNYEGVAHDNAPAKVAALDDKDSGGIIGGEVKASTRKSDMDYHIQNRRIVVTMNSLTLQ